MKIYVADYLFGGCITAVEVISETDKMYHVQSGPGEKVIGEAKYFHKRVFKGPGVCLTTYDAAIYIVCACLDKISTKEFEIVKLRQTIANMDGVK